MSDVIVSSGYCKIGFDAYGGKFMEKADMAHWVGSPDMEDPRGVCFQLDEEIEEVEPGFFEMLPTICELRIYNPKCRLYPTDAELELFRRNDVVIRGAFGGAAEKLARKYGLRFLHREMVLGRSGNYFSDQGIDIITLRFYDNGDAYINQDCRCQGSSAGSIGGGEIDFDLPKDWYLNMSAEDVAGECWGTCYEAILKNGVLAGLIKKARAKKGFLLDFRKKEG